MHMRVAIVLNTSWNIYNFRTGLIKSLITKGYEVHAIAPRDEYSPKLIDLGCVYHEVKMDSRGANPVKDSLLILELWSIYRNVNPDVILHYTIKPNIYGSFAASFLNIPVINNVCGLGTSFLNENLVSKIALKLYKWAFRTPKLVYFQNTDDLNFFVKNDLIRKEQTDLLPGSGINLERFKPLKPASSRKFSFLLVSRLILDKGIVEYVDAINILKSRGVDAEFNLLGSKDPKHRRGISEQIINKWVSNQSINYLGATDDVRPYLQDSHCVVLPSYREGTPKSLIEAASSQRPIVATNVAGCNNIVQNGVNGLLCKPKDARDLADKMEEMLNLSDSVRESMGKKGRQIVEDRFNEDIIIEKYMSEVQKIEQTSKTFK